MCQSPSKLFDFVVVVVIDDIVVVDPLNMPLKFGQNQVNNK